MKFKAGTEFFRVRYNSFTLWLAQKRVKVRENERTNEDP